MLPQLMPGNRELLFSVLGRCKPTTVLLGLITRFSLWKTSKAYDHNGAIIMTHNVTLASLIMYILFRNLYRQMQFNWLSELSRNINRGRRRRLLGTSRSRMYCKTHVLELELQGVTWADNGQDCCRLVTRVRNLPINQHDRSCSPGTSETGASSC